MCGPGRKFSHFLRHKKAGPTLLLVHVCREQMQLLSVSYSRVRNYTTVANCVRAVLCKLRLATLPTRLSHGVKCTLGFTVCITPLSQFKSRCLEPSLVRLPTKCSLS